MAVYSTGPRKPRITDVVVYNHPGDATGKFPPKTSPGIIQKVNDDGTVEMIVFSTYGGLFFNHSVERGTGPTQWCYEWEMAERNREV